VDAGRRRARAAQVEIASGQWQVEVLSPDPADAVVAGEDTDAALRLVAQLSPLQAEAVVLRVVAGLSVEEVARIVGRSPGAVRVATHRGLRRLEQVLADRGVTPSRAGTL
jgi:RNA polymerase sigma-70 factor (ECF subfamily)